MFLCLIHLLVRGVLHRGDGALEGADGPLLRGRGRLDHSDDGAVLVLLLLALLLHVEQLLDGLRLELGGGEVAALDGQVAEQPLLVGLLEDVLLDRALAYQPVDVDVSGLADPVAPETYGRGTFLKTVHWDLFLATVPVLRLCVHGRVPVRVVEDDGVGARQIDAHSARASRQDETKVSGMNQIDSRLNHASLR